MSGWAEVRPDDCGCETGRSLETVAVLQDTPSRTLQLSQYKCEEEEQIQQKEPSLDGVRINLPERGENSTVSDVSADYTPTA